MFCTQCGNKVADDSRFCSYCGSATSHSERLAQAGLDESENSAVLKQAKTVVPAARALSVSSFAQTASDLPLLKAVRVDDWDFFVTVASVFIAASTINRLGDPEVEDSALDVITTELNAWNRDALRAFEDCKEMFERTFDELALSPPYLGDRQFLACDSVGLWIAWNLLGQKPSSEDEYKLVRTVGILTTASFANWWAQPEEIIES